MLIFLSLKKKRKEEAGAANLPATGPDLLRCRGCCLQENFGGWGVGRVAGRGQASVARCGFAPPAWQSDGMMMMSNGGESREEKRGGHDLAPREERPC